MPVEQVIDEGCGCGPVEVQGGVPVDAVNGQPWQPVLEHSPEVLLDGASTEAVEGEQTEVEEVAEVIDRDHVPAPSFLKRFSSWMSTSNNIES